MASIVAALANSRRVLVTSHERCDGDAVGTTLGIMHMLQAMGKEVIASLSDPVPDSLADLPGVEQIVSTLPKPGIVDTVVVLECDSLRRTGFSPAALEGLGQTVTLNIDHHLSGRRYADLNWIDPTSPAVGAMVADLARSTGLPVSPAMATCLYAALITDTGSFSFQSTNAHTFSIAEFLLDQGADAFRVARRVFASNSIAKMRILGIVLSRLQVRGDVCWSYVTMADRVAVGANVEDCEGIVNHLINIAGIEVAVFLREQEATSLLRASIRSKGAVDVATIAEHFGGGGHHNASGCSLQGPPEQALKHLLALRERG